MFNIFTGAFVQIRQFAGSALSQSNNYLKLYLLRHKINRLAFMISLVLIFLQLVLVLFAGWRFRSAGESVALRYNVYFGVDLLGGWTKLLFYPLAGLFILIINTATSLATYRKNKLIASYLLIITPVLLLVSLLNLIFTLIINLEFLLL